MNDLPYGRSEKGKPVIVNYFYHEKIRLKNKGLVKVPLPLSADQDFPFKVCVRTFLAADFFCAAAPKEPLKKAMQHVANKNFFILLFKI